MSISAFLNKYWTLTPPVRLKRNDSFNGICITPEHESKRVLTLRDEDIVSITPIHQKYGDDLNE